MSQRFLLAGGIGSALVSLLHIVMPFLGPRAYIWFGAGEEMATMAEQNFWPPALLTWAIAIVFEVFALYAFSAVGLIRKLPFVKPIVIIIGVIYTLRGLMIVLALVEYFQADVPELRWTVFSAVSLGIGVMYLWGIFAGKKNSM